MKRIVVAALLIAGTAAWAQVSNPSIVVVASAPSGSCTQNLPDRQVVGLGTIYTCQSGTWALVNGGSGGSGTVSSGTTGQIAYYPANGTAVSGASGVTTDGAGNAAVTGTVAATGLSTSLIVLAAGTPITSQSSANSQMVTCPATGSGTQVCDAAGSWISPSTGSLLPTGATVGGTAQSQVFTHGVTVPLVTGNSSAALTMVADSGMGSGGSYTAPACFTGANCTQLSGTIVLTVGSSLPAIGNLMHLVDGGSNRTTLANCGFTAYNSSFVALGAYNAGSNSTIEFYLTDSVAPVANTAYLFTYNCGF
jgi:hypothetical protein